MADWEISHGQPGDEAFFALIQTESWKAAFRDILTPEVLENATQLPKATAMYRRLLEQHIGHGYLLRVDGQPHCIAWWDRSRDGADFGADAADSGNRKQPFETRPSIGRGRRF